MNSIFWKCLDCRAGNFLFEFCPSCYMRSKAMANALADGQLARSMASIKLDHVPWTMAKFMQRLAHEEQIRDFAGRLGLDSAPARSIDFSEVDE